MVLNGLKEGYRPVVFNQRGTGGIKLKVGEKRVHGESWAQ